jgi:hypothetical protein
MGALKKLLDKAEAAEKNGRWDMVQYYLSQAIELAKLNSHTDYLPSSERAKNG